MYAYLFAKLPQPGDSERDLVNLLPAIYLTTQRL